MASIRLNKRTISLLFSKNKEVNEARTKGALGKKTLERMAREAEAAAAAVAQQAVLDVADNNTQQEPVNIPVSDQYIEKKRVDSHAEDIVSNLLKIDKKNIASMWNDIVGRTELANLQEKAVKTLKKSQVVPHTDISKLDKITVLKADGTMDEIYPARIARYANYFVSQLGKDPETAILKKYYPKNIIWTFEVPTAATDGVRVFFNPAFADHLFSLDFILKERRLKSNPNLDPDDIDGTMFKFTLIHEIYHQIYRHMYRIRMKPETANAMQEPRIMDLANIACDVEINRDIEFQLPQFEGCTEVLQGMYDKRFTHETWELIFDAYNDPNSGKLAPQQGGAPKAGKNPQLNLQGQLGQQGQQNQQNQQGLQNQLGLQGQLNQLDQLDQQNGGGNGQPSLDDKSPSYIKGFMDALEKIKRGEIDINKLAKGIISEAVDFNNLLSYRTKGALGRKTREAQAQLAAQLAADINIDEPTSVQNSPAANIPQVNSNDVTFDTGDTEQFDEFNKNDYDQGFADALNAIKNAIQNQNKNNSNSSSNIDMPDIPNKSNGGDSDEDDEGDGEDDEESGNGKSKGDNSNKDDDSESDNSKSKGNGSDNSEDGDDDGDDVQDDAGDVDKVIDGSNMGPAEAGDFEEFGASDLMDKETARRIAENAGQPYDADDIAEDPETKAKKFVEMNKEQLRKLGSHSKGKGNCMSDVLDHIDSLFKSKVDWRHQLQYFLNGLAKTGVDYEFQRRRIGSHDPVLKASKYIKYNDIKFDQKTAIAQVFYLVDNSGSMYGQSVKGDDDVFTQIFSEIIHMQKRAKIQKSAFTYFASDAIDKRKIRMWDLKASESQIKHLIARNHDDSGGTDIPGSIKLIYDMGKPYYSKNDPKTLMIVMTDGEDNLTVMKNLPSVIKLNIIFMILNESQRYLNSAYEQLSEAGIRNSRILLVDTHDI